MEQYGFEKISFAGPLRRGVSELFGIDPEVLNDPALKEKRIKDWGMSPRELMQWLGTDILRNEIRDDFFIHSAKIGMIHKRRVVFSDTRFDNEAKFIQEMNGEVWKIEGRMSKYIDRSSSGHSTEIGVDPMYIDDTINNSGDLDKTMEQVDNLVRSLIF